MIVGLGHTARVGKDSLADALVRNHGFTRLAFADALRDFVYRTHPEVSFLVDMYGWENAKTTYPAQVRRVLIDTGNAARQIMGEDVWIRAVARQIEPGRDYVITDVRYPNEVAWIQRASWGVQTTIAVKVTRPGVEPGRDVADRALADFDEWDYEVENDGTLDDLAKKAHALVMLTRHKGANLGR